MKLEIIDYDNMVGFIVTESEYNIATSAINEGKIIAIDGEVFLLDECLDADGTITLDEDGYDQMKTLLGR